MKKSLNKEVLTMPYALSKLCQSTALGTLIIALPGAALGKAVFMAAVALTIILLSLSTSRKELAKNYNYLWQHQKVIAGAWLAVLISWLISGYMGIAPDYKSFERAFGFMIMFIAMTHLGVLVYVQGYSWQQKLFKGLAITGGVVALMMLIDRSGLFPMLSELLHGEAASGRGRQYNVGPVFAVIIPLAWMVARKPLDWIWPLFMVADIVCSDSRSAWVGLFVGAFIYLPAAVKNRQFWPYAIHGSVGAVIGAALYLYSLGYEMVVVRTGIGVSTASLSGREAIWQTAWQNFIENPIWGIGIRGFRYVDTGGIKLASQHHPHNFILQLLLETGLVGTALFVVALGLIARSLIYKNMPNHVAMAFYAVIMAFFTVSLTFTSFFHVWWLLLGVTMFMLALSYRTSH